MLSELLLQDPHVFDPDTIYWRELSFASHGTPPSPRMGHGFASVGSKLYVHGGEDSAGVKSLHNPACITLAHGR